MKKVMNIGTWAALTALAGTSVLNGVQSASAQEASSSTRFSVDLKDATLRDALELVFQAAGNPPHVIDPAASQVRIGSVSFKDQEWRDIVRTLANLNKFRFRRESGSWIIDPRSAARTSRTFSSTTASSFQMRDFTAKLRTAAAKTDFSVETRSSRQAGGNQGGGGGGGAGGGGGSNQSLDKPAPVDSNNPWTIIEPLHIYAGAIALFFESGTVATTEAFIVPGVAFSSHLGGNLLNRPGYIRGGVGGGTTTNNTGGTTGGTTGGSGTSR